MFGPVYAVCVLMYRCKYHWRTFGPESLCKSESVYVNVEFNPTVKPQLEDPENVQRVCTISCQTDRHDVQ